MIIGKYIIWFISYSFIGYCAEVIYCTSKTGKWQNRGFLYGPICPIYGVSGVAITIFQNYFQLDCWQIFLVALVGSAIVEYITSWILEKIFHAYWWDYSDRPFNINGRVCLPMSAIFGISGVFITEILVPMLEDMTSSMPELMMELAAIFVIAILASDITLTVSVLTDFNRQIVDLEANIDLHMETLVKNLQEAADDRKKLALERRRFTDQRMEFMTRNMGWMPRNTLKRVKGFKPVKKSLQHKTSNDEENKQRMLNSLKNYHSEKNTDKTAS